MSPGFAEMDDRAAALLRDEIVEEMADGAGMGSVDGIAAQYTGDDLGKLTAAIVKNREALTTACQRAQIFGWFGVQPGTDLTTVMPVSF